MKNEWKIIFKVKDRHLYGKGLSTLPSLNVDVPTEMLPAVWKIICDEVQRLEKEERA